MVELLPPNNAKLIVTQDVDSAIAGMAFRHYSLRRNPNIYVDYNSILGNAPGNIFMVNGFPINGYIYDANGKSYHLTSTPTIWNDSSYGWPFL